MNKRIVAGNLNQKVSVECEWKNKKRNHLKISCRRIYSSKLSLRKWEFELEVVFIHTINEVSFSWDYFLILQQRSKWTQFSARLLFYLLTAEYKWTHLPAPCTTSRVLINYYLKYVNKNTKTTIFCLMLSGAFRCCNVSSVAPFKST